MKEIKPNKEFMKHSAKVFWVKLDGRKNETALTGEWEWKENSVVAFYPSFI
jgi:hypothetical protein